MKVVKYSTDLCKLKAKHMLQLLNSYPCHPLITALAALYVVEVKD